MFKGSKLKNTQVLNSHQIIGRDKKENSGILATTRLTFLQPHDLTNFPGGLFLVGKFSGHLTPHSPIPRARLGVRLAKGCIAQWPVLAFERRRSLSGLLKRSHSYASVEKHRSPVSPRIPWFYTRRVLGKRARRCNHPVSLFPPSASARLQGTAPPPPRPAPQRGGIRRHLRTAHRLALIG